MQRADAQRPTIRLPRQRGAIAVAERARFMSKHPLCAVCMRRGVLIPGTQVDHVVPLFRGGLDIDANKQTLCDACHKVKTAADCGKARHPGSDANGEPIGAKW
jgi:5-methylcytosine-specific restriction protein A